MNQNLNEYGGEDNSRYYDNAPIECQFAGQACPVGTLAHPDSLGDCCAACEYSGMIHELKLIEKRMANSAWQKRLMLRGEYQSTMEEAMRWLQPMCDQALQRPVKHLHEYAESVAA